MQKYLVASVYRDQGDEGTPTFCDPQIVWGVSAKSACKSGRYPNSTDTEGQLWGAPEALAIVCPDGRLSYLTHYDYRLVDEAHSKAIDYTNESAPRWDLRTYLEKQKVRYEKRKKQLDKVKIEVSSSTPNEAPFHMDTTKFYVVAAIITANPGAPVLKFWKTHCSSGEWTDDIAQAAHYQSAGVAASKFEKDRGYLSRSGIPFLKTHYGDNVEFRALEATATVEFRKV